MVELGPQLQQHQQVTRLSRVTHLVQVVVSAKTGCMLFRFARIRKILLMLSLVRYESLISMFMLC